MRITVIGGGPGGLYFALLTRKRRPDWQVAVYEQNLADDTFGFGVVFSDETLHEFLSRDRRSFERIRGEFAYWDDVAIHKQGTEMRCAGNGFAGISRMKLLNILQQRCREEGVEMHFGVCVPPEEIATRFAGSDVVVAADGVNSRIREHFRESFRPEVAIKSNRFCWMGSTRPMEEFNYFFRETEHGIICAHTYQYETGRSTWIFEMDDGCWRGHGFDRMDEERSKALLEQLYAGELQGHGLLLNRSNWRQFPRIFCQNWSHRNIVLLGDAKASAHYSIGSGTKLAMECAIALSDAVVEHGEAGVEQAFAAYEGERRAPCQIIQHKADVSLAWFEHMNRSWDMEPEQFAMVVMCRAKSITYDNLMVRDPGFVEKVDTAFYERLFRETGEDYRNTRPTPMFTRFKLRDMVVENRVVMSPMAQYSADGEGNLTDWHFVHYTSHALGGAGMVFVEMTCPSADARITPGCPGLWTDEHEAQFKRIVDFVHAHSKTRMVMQLGHAGRKGSTQLGWQKMDAPLEDKAKNWPLFSASDIPYMAGVSDTPKALDRADMDRIRADFVQATERAERAGFDMVELHCAHGYLLASFLSPLTNRRTDEYGGPIENRLRFPLEVFAAMRAVWPAEKPMSVRVSASDWAEGGISEADTIAISEAFAEAGCDLIDVSAGQTVAEQKPVYGRMFQVAFAEAIRNVPKLSVMAVGAITEAAQVNTILHTRRADLVALGRPHLWNPYFTREASAWYDARNQHWPKQYLAGRDQAHRELSKKRGQEMDLRRKARPRPHELDEPSAERREAAE
ncbi:bifunctional salicylyl-CoA 5-hydroxylase/oxidoreductase [Jiella sonneratiae]|uniref:Bifunctional salicylyl-CoA 5-hydroxylase/oxidoreductase n=1 Tax=Jiella sonneratiae TaxID=2816856 RepID=A0ABS3IZU2_9HYPH|nr:bifunctional salicylyl-CoA 5-hydroxylase/oxidoreductase [Jiella sonneratiae]MBO0902243.1 bifunctional salicylyl-CoA 5-hydroxylase/oxidoreductase [Jiella sonneratiae]